MNKRDILFTFINTIQEKKLLTDFIINIFDYDNFHDYNYLFRMTKDETKIIIDIYDNVSDNRFNRYIFDFGISNNKTKIMEDGNVYVTYINVLKLADSDNKLYKLAYLTKLDGERMISYASTFLNQCFVNILKNIIEK